MQAATLQNNSQVAELFATAIDRMFRPIIRMFVGRVSCHYMLQMLRKIYIEEARRWIEKNADNAKVTKSKLALLTGLDTRTIDAVESASRTEEPLSASAFSAEAAVLERWVQDKDYHDDQGKPDRLAVFGRPRTFETLSKPLIGRAVTCNTVLDRLLEAGNVRVIDEDYVELVNPYFQPVGSSEALLFDVGSKSISRHARTVHYNIHTPEFQKRRLQRDRWSFQVPADQFDTARAELRTVIEQHILEVEGILERYENPELPSGGTLGVGWFFFE